MNGASPNMRRRWRRMIARCTNPNDKDWRYYGGRGISVAQEWLDFETFSRDVGDPPAPDLTLDRIDNNGDYRPGNVRWATQADQNRNKRDGRSHRHECKAGHPYDEINTYRPRTGGRVCRTCNNDATRRYKARKRAEFKETSDD